MAVLIFVYYPDFLILNVNFSFIVGFAGLSDRFVRILNMDCGRIMGFINRIIF